MDFVIGHSVCGGTGSGLGALSLERLAVDYRKKTKISFEIYPSPNLSTCVAEPYNALLAMHWLLGHTEVSLSLDNKAIYGICQKQCELPNQIFERVSNELSTFHSFTLYDYCGMGLIIPKIDVSTAPNDIQKITDNCFKPAIAEDKYMAISLNYSGDIKSKEANATVQWLKSNNKITLVEWCPTGFKIGFNDVPAVTLESDDIGAFSKNAVTIANNTGISRVLSKHIARSMILCTPKSICALDVGKGMEGEFAEAVKI
ncbi:hypothetical protein RFI_20423 [Reticulomyxa filosa]|uniref:Tubulin alpha chain n=1 Tax=Reticulomyxa filosa TaxID=46433 RepID=X6MSX6_RETFI|nr:hypothetical protein RFI_20423 [Reticulomyxa filosa]|eukprot:ETO16914.1 hypothetical protein RFI_20423 [Reticulomyxa filosa]